MLRLRDNNIIKPAPYPSVERKDPTVSDKGWDKVGGFMLRDKIDFMPQRGLQEKLCACSSNLIFLCGAATMGKMQPYDSKILTPNGFVEMGSLKIGDTISGADGGQQTVLGIFEQGVKDVYRLTFDDGGQTECGDEHLWKVFTKNKKSTRYNKPCILDTMEMMSIFDNGGRVAIPICSPIYAFNSSELPIKPYTLGALLGDGGLTDRWNQMFTTIDPQIVDRIREDGYECRQKKHDNRRYLIRGDNMRTKIDSLGLRGKHSWEKYIPEIYKTASLEDRIGLIQGLFDTDGTVGVNGSRIIYVTTSKKLALDVQWICRSLGCRCKIHTSIHTYTHKGEIRTGRLQYRLTVSVSTHIPLFNLERKRLRHINRLNNHKSPKAYRKLSKYEYVGRKQCRCILVSNPDHLYITDDFIVTHNTYGMFLKSLEGIDKNGYTARMISVRLQDSKKGSSIFRDAVEVCGNFAGCEYNSSDYPTFSWKKWNSNLQLIHLNFNVNNPQEWEDFQEYCKKQQSSKILVDEATDAEEKALMYLFSRNRDSSGMTPQSIWSFNPKHEHFTTRVLKDAGYLGDDWFFKPEMNGATRYFYMMGDTFADAIWGETPEEVAERANIQISDGDKAAGVTIYHIVKSFTAFTGEASDNRKLIAATKGQVIGNLHAVGKTQRSILKGAYFGPVDNEELTVSRQMIHALWENPVNEDENMYATMDVSGGGEESDNCPMVIWKGLQIIAIKMFSGDPKQLVAWIDNTLQEYGVPKEHFAFDATGIGYYLRSYSSGVPITANKRVLQEYDEYGNPVTLTEYFNLRSQLLGKTKVLFEKGELSCAVEKDLVIPYGKKGKTRRLIDILFDEMNVFTTLSRNRKIYYRHKDEYRSKFKSSPDLMDAISYRSIFELDAREKKAPPKEIPDNAYNGLYQNYGRGQNVVWV